MSPQAKPSPSDPPTLTVGVIIMTVILGGFALWALRSLLEPLALAMFLLMLIDGMARALDRHTPWLAKAAALPAAILVITVLFALTVWALTSSAKSILAQAGLYGDKLNTLLANASGRFGVGIPSSLDELIQEINPKHYAGAVAEAIRQFAENTILVLIYLGFLLASRAGFTGKLDRLFITPARRAEAHRVIGRMRHGVESYIWVQTVVGLMIAIASAMVMAALGLSHILFWSFIIFLASYIPVIGAAIGVLFPPLFALLELSDWWRALAMLIALELVHFAVSHVLQPRLQGRSLNVDPLIVLVSLAFWGLLWGVTGAFLSTPLTVLGMVVLAEFPATRWVAMLLSRDGEPYEAAE